MNNGNESGGKNPAALVYKSAKIRVEQPKGADTMRFFDFANELMRREHGGCAAA